MNRWARVVRDTLPLIGAAMGLVILFVAAVAFQDSEGFAYDFAAYDSAARRVLAGEPLYLPGTSAAYSLGEFEGLYLYPPPVALALTPLALLSTDAAAIAWYAFRVVLLAAGCALLPVTWAARMVTFAVAAVSFPVLFDLNLGNISVVIYALTALAWRLADGPAAATVHAALVFLRIPFGVFGFLWLAQRRWRMVAHAIVAGLVIIAIALPVVGLDGYREYLSILTTLPDVSAGEHNFSLKSMALDAGLGVAIANLALLGGVLLGVLAVVFAGLRRDRDTAFVVASVATLLTAPFLHPHYLVILLLPAALLFDRLSPAAGALPLVGWLPGSILPLVSVVLLAILLMPAVSRRDPQRLVAGSRPAAGVT